MLRLDLGCGNNKKPGFTGVDNNPHAKPDVRHDLDRFPYPFKDNSVDEVYMAHALEHVNGPFRTLAEIYRMCKPGARVTIRVPHYSYGWAHPLHKQAFSINTFRFLEPGSSERYENVDFEVKKVTLRWRGMPPKIILDKLFPLRVLANAFNIVVNFFANLYPYAAERVWAYWVGGFDDMQFDLIVVKPARKSVRKGLSDLEEPPK